jgi:hypothetical protein
MPRVKIWWRQAAAPVGFGDRWPSRLALLVIFAASAPFTGYKAMAKDLVPVAPERWGGQQIILTVGEASSRIELGCGEAVIDGSLRVDEAGRFKASGRIESVQPGPQRTDRPSAVKDALFEGRIDGDRMELSIQAAGEPEPRRFELKRHARTKIIRCY